METYHSSLYPFESKWTKIQGNNVHYIDEGDGNVLLFCHPSITSSFMYRDMIPELSKHFRCIALDFPGFGLSELSATYQHSIKSQAEVLRVFIDQMGLTAITLLMQEIGGHAAMQVFLEKPHLLQSIIITDTIIFPLSQYPKIKSMLNFVNGRFFRFLNIHLNFLAWGMPRYGVRKRKLERKVLREYQQLFQAKELRATVCDLLYELVVQEALLSNILSAFETTFNQLPALIIYGEKDPLSEFGIPQRTHQLFPNSTLHWIADEAHFPHEGAPLEMAELIIQHRYLQEKT